MIYLFFLPRISRAPSYRGKSESSRVFSIYDVNLTRINFTNVVCIWTIRFEWKVLGCVEMSSST